MVIVNSEPNHLAIPPWQCPEDWKQLVCAFEHVTALRWLRLHRARKLAGEIGQRLDGLSSSIDMLCNATCVCCKDVCCRKATVWYDYKDLLYLHLFSGCLPAGQISRKNDLSCCNLTPSGCRLHRVRRPFICTWYICPSQMKMLVGEKDKENRAVLQQAIGEIQALRIELEKAFIDAVC